MRIDMRIYGGVMLTIVEWTRYVCIRVLWTDALFVSHTALLSSWYLFLLYAHIYKPVRSCACVVMCVCIGYRYRNGYEYVCEANYIYLPAAR